MSNSKVLVRLLLQGAGSQPISTSGTSAETISNGINSLNRLQFSICSTLPPAYFGSLTSILLCNYVVILTYLGASSLDINAIISGGSFTSADEASNVVASTFATGTSLDGVSVLSTSASA